MIRVDSQTRDYNPHVPGDDPRYKAAVAEPVMQAVDAMPERYRALVHEFGYIDVYRAWKRGWGVEKIRANVRDGAFHLA